MERNPVGPMCGFLFLPSFLDSDCFESSDGAATDRHLAGSHHVNERAREESNDPRVAAARSPGCSAAAATGIAE